MQNLEARNKRLEADSKFYETNWRREAQVRAVLQQKLENMRQGGPLEKP